jgi:DNA repair protein RadC
LSAIYRRSSDAVDVELFDHIIVGRKTYYSYREAKRL